MLIRRVGETEEEGAKKARARGRRLRRSCEGIAESRHENPILEEGGN